ncbi:hypothetical protein UA08_00031 [Talaromyces atroroseus]|uniref:MARVEL domain-containing protein n=1 Tax=Talaromyces atroroseus TaxID=1441469 RepID=A0A225B215_TALAT|nr:hypothetical protein UA08_00031 [Talaromyces atroroseus]OKL63758.1 hypothetical protein UA08_00031 [Talaromyces atroroseus]
MAAQEWDPLLPKNAIHQTGRNYTGILTKTIVYGLTLLFFFLAYAFTISSIVLPSWPEDCHGEDRYFCSMWRSVGFFMTFAVVLMSLAIVAYVIILSGGKKIRETGWQVLSTIIIMSVAVQVASMALVAYLFDNDERFFVGWELDKSFAFCTASWCISLFCAVSVIVAARTLPPEGGYELIPNFAHDAEEVH